MSYELTFEERPNYLYARVISETVDQEMVVEYLHRVIDRSIELGADRVMIEREIPDTLSVGSQFFAGKEFVAMGIASIWIAFVDAYEENREDLEFAMLIANNRGAHLQLFRNVADGESWLLLPNHSDPPQ